LADVAAAATVEQFGRRVRNEASRILADDGIARLERQRRDTTMSTWVDHDGMWVVRGRFDPVTGMRIASRLETTVETLFADTTPDTCPSDPIARQQHLRALAFARLVDGTAGPSRRGRSEFVAVIDVAADVGEEPPHRDGAIVTWPIPIEVPQRVLAELMDAADVHTVVVRNGVVLHAPGELDLGRSRSIQAGNDRPHTGARDVIDRDTHLIQHSEHANMRDTARPSTAQRHANSGPVAHFLVRLKCHYRRIRAKN
jgi:hypothetical protein